MTAIEKWIESKPGPFVARTEKATLNKAWRNFNDGDTGQIHSQLDFLIQLGEAEIELKATGLGGYCLQRVT